MGVTGNVKLGIPRHSIAPSSLMPDATGTVTIINSPLGQMVAQVGANGQVDRKQMKPISKAEILQGRLVLQIC